MPKTILIPIPISKSSAPRFRNSVEGLNQEIERIIIRDTPDKDETIVVSSERNIKTFFTTTVRVLSPRCYVVIVTSFVCDSHRMSQMGTARPHRSPRSAAAAPAASTRRPPRGAA